MDDLEARIGELLLRARDLEQEAEGLRAQAGRLIREAARTAAGGPTRPRFELPERLLEERKSEDT